MKDETAIVAKMFGGTEIATDEQFEFDGPSGFEGVDRDCTTIPFLKIAQGSTEQAKKGSTKKIDGLEPGMFFCPATNKVYGENANLIILRFYRQYIVYESREIDAHFLGSITPDEFDSDVLPTAVREKSYHVSPDGKRYVDTRNFIVLVAGALNDGPMLLSLSSTGISPSKKWLTQAQSVRDKTGRVAPIWANVWSLHIGYEDNPQGSYYQISQIERMGYVTEAARHFVVSAFLDAQGINAADIQGVEAKAEEPKVADGSHKEGPKAEPAKNADEIF